MKKIALIILLLSIATIVDAQNGYFINPYVGAGTTGATNNILGNSIIRYHNTSSTIIGLQAGRKMGIIQLSIGAALLKTGYKIKDVTFANQYDPQTGNTVTAPLDVISTIRQVLIPVKIGLNIKGDKLSFIPQVGLAPAIPLGYVEQYVQSNNNKEVNRITGSYNTFAVLGLASADIAYHINDHLAATLGPSFNFTLTNFTTLSLQPLYGLTGNLGVILSL